MYGGIYSFISNKIISDDMQTLKLLSMFLVYNTFSRLTVLHYWERTLQTGFQCYMVNIAHFSP